MARECPLVPVREKLKLSRIGLAEASGSHVSTVANCEKGLASAIPAAIRVYLTPLLPRIGTTIERLDSAFRLWKLERQEDRRRETEEVSR